MRLEDFSVEENKERIEALYKRVESAAYDKLLFHEHKGDWLKRRDKTTPYMMSGLICEIGELQKALSQDQPIENVLEECGDILNYLIMIVERFEKEKEQPL